MRILYAGNNQRGVQCLEALVGAREPVVGVIAHPKGSEDKGYYASVRPAARRLGVPVFSPEDINDPEFAERIFTQLAPDIMVMAGYAYLVRPPFFKRFSHGCLNLHASPLPLGRGAAPLNWALIRGESRWGISIIDIDAGIDTGDILAQTHFGIDGADTIETLTQRVNRLYPRLLMETLKKIRSGDVTRIAQDPEQGSYFTKRFPRDGRIDWDRMTAEQIHNLVRALTRPYPGAFTFFRGEKVIVWETEPLATDYFGVPGRVAAMRNASLVVMAKDRGVKVKTVQMGETVMPAARMGARAGNDFLTFFESPGANG